MVDAINKKYILVRASTGKNNQLIPDYDLPIEGGIPVATFVKTVKLFQAIPRAAIKDCDKEQIVE